MDDTAGTRTGQTRVAEYIVEAVVATIAAAALLVALVGGAANAQEARSVDLDVRKTVSPKTVEVGERQVFTVKVTNDGTTRAERVSMRDPLPSKVRFIRASSSREVPGSCGIEDRVVKCRLGTLRADEMETVKIYVRPVVAGSSTNRAYASFDNTSARASDASGVSDAAKAIVEARSR